jgi:serine/threonine-protein kinase
MTGPQFVGPAPASTPAFRISRGHTRTLPADLLRDASRRLGIIAVLAAVLWAVGTVLYHIALRAMSPAGDTRWLAPLASDAFVVPGVIASALLFVYTRRSGRDPRVIVDLGLGYMVFTAFLLGMTLHWDHVPYDTPIAPQVSWIGAITLAFAAIIPSTPLKTLIAVLIAVSMNPIGMLIARARGAWDFGPATNALLMHYPDYLLAGVAVVISHVHTTLGQQVAKAREMGSYQIGELLGQGGMGEVYRATHRLLARPAAIKLIRPEVIASSSETSELAIKRFQREADVAARLRSPHTVELYDFGVTDDDRLYFVMELLDGMTLETLVRTTGPVPAARAVHILCQVCDSLDEAHAYGLVHRDIKPANLHIGRVGLREDFIKVLDFGLVKAVDRPDDGQSMATQANLTPGTPAYMSPELLSGAAIDGRADIYALGCVAYFLMSGSLVFEADSVMQMLVKHLSAAPIPLSQRTELPIAPALEQIVMACLAKDPADRPQSAEALSRLLAAVQIEPWSEASAAAWWKLHRS